MIIILKHTYRVITKDGKEIIIHNVPYEEFEAEGREFYSVETCVKVWIISDLIYEGKIQNEVDYDLVVDMKL